MAADTSGGQSAAQVRRSTVDAVIRRHDKLLVQWLTHKFGDPELARDIAQSAYLRVWRYAEKGEIANPRALLFKTAANLAANEFRARRRARQVLCAASGIAGDVVDKVACEIPSPERAAAARQDLEASISVIRAMPGRVRRAFILNRFEGKNYREIAREMKVSESSIEKYIISALKLLRSAVQEEKPSAKVISFAHGKRATGSDRS